MHLHYIFFWLRFFFALMPRSWPLSLSPLLIQCAWVCFFLATLTCFLISGYPLSRFSFSLFFPRPRFFIRLPVALSRSPPPCCLPVMCLSPVVLGSLAASCSLWALSAALPLSSGFFAPWVSSLRWLPLCSLCCFPIILSAFIRSASFLTSPPTTAAASRLLFYSLLRFPVPFCALALSRALHWVFADAFFSLRLSSYGLRLSAHPWVVLRFWLWSLSVSPLSFPLPQRFSPLSLLAAYLSAPSHCIATSQYPYGDVQLAFACYIFGFAVSLSFRLAFWDLILAFWHPLVFIFS